MAKSEVKFAWDGVKQMQKALAEVGVSLEDTNPDIKSIILELAAKKWLAHARSLVPVKTGALQKALYVTKGGKKQRGVYMGVRRKLTVTHAGTGVKYKAPMYYAWFVENGTSKMGAHPYFRPALLAMASTYAADIAPGVQKLIEATAAKNAWKP